MAGRSKKRQASESPSRTVATKKARQTSASVSVRSERGSSNPSASRAKLVFRGHRDPYFPLRNKGATSLPTGDDYMFRIQVISTTTVVNADVFKKAVQGLVKICFPQDVLEEIGIEVVTQHMRNQDAPEPNIAKMTGVFRSEMIHRIVWMLAEYLDTPEKVEASVKAIMAASATLHGMKISEGVLDDVTSSLNNLRDQVPSGSTERLANSTDIEIPSFRIPDGDTTGSNNGGSMLEEDSIEDETMANIPGNDVEGNVGPPPSISKKHGRHKDPEKRFESAVKASANGNHTPIVAEPPASIRNSRNGKASKISTSWRWDIKDNMNIDEVSSHFRRTSDLFAYHALPIARRALGSHAKRKEIRQEMEKMLTNIPDDEFERWVESFVKLEAGDLTILERVSVDVECASHQVVSATAAPVDLRRSRDERTDTRSDVNDVTSHSQSEVKREVDADKQMVETISQERADADATKTVQGPAADTNSSSLQDNGHNRKHAPTPVVDIVWGSAPLDLSNVKQTVQKITDAISKRTSMKSTAIPHSDGTTTVQSLQDLQQKLIFILTDQRSKSYPFRKRTVCDQKLLPWALANIAAFPELQNQSLVFVNIMPYLSTVLELVCDPHVSLTPPNKSRVQADILVGLEQRGFNAHTLYGPNQEHLFQAIRSILGETLDDVKKLGFLEKYFRQLAFDHKPSFPELRNTPLVRACERESGSRW